MPISENVDICIFIKAKCHSLNWDEQHHIYYLSMLNGLNPERFILLSRTSVTCSVSHAQILLVEQFALVRGLNPFPSWANLGPSLNCTFLICRIFFGGFVVRIEILLITFLVDSLWNSNSFPHFYFLLISSSWPLLWYQNRDLLKLEIFTV